jgi:hypothetical protein
MSVLKTQLACPSRIRGIYRYLLGREGQAEERTILEQRLSPLELAKDKSTRPMLNDSLREGIKCGLFVEKEGAIAINPNLPEIARDPSTGDRELPNTLSELFFASGNEDEYDFGVVCAWFLYQDVYDPPKTWEEVQKIIPQQKADVKLNLKMTSDALYGQAIHWMQYLGLIWKHSFNKQKAIVPDPTLYLKRNLPYLFQASGEKVPIREFIDRLARKCPLFETGQFREAIERGIEPRPVNFLSTSTAFALFRLREAEYIDLMRESDADLLLSGYGIRKD